MVSNKIILKRYLIMKKLILLAIGTQVLNWAMNKYQIHSFTGLKTKLMPYLKNMMSFKSTLALA